MQKSLIDRLRKQFPMFTRDEVGQTVLLAELKASDEPLAWRIAQCDLLDMLKRETRRQHRYPSIETLLTTRTKTAGECDDSGEGPVTETEWLCTEDKIFERWLVEAEWASIVHRLPPLARKLAEIAKRSAETFEDVPGGVWTAQSLLELRRRIKREFIAWERNHSERKYFLARRTLVEVLHRNRRKP